ncbi:MAG: thioesterase family protein [Ruminococcus flavefaciens]|nr:thioesterase family protein [Ruminococcus flavefaciens]MCM1229647.1 thioesterase family protein [Ruminococcus flavefaciens]
MKPIEINIKGTAETTVTDDKLAVTVGSGSLAVFATPAMTALMEESACNCLVDYLNDDETTVGTELSIRHISATPAGMKITAEAVLTEINGREFTFEVTAYDECGIIGKGSHKRFLVYSEKFTAKTYEKLNK